LSAPYGVTNTDESVAMTVKALARHAITAGEVASSGLP
jgi:hypothetical protein